MIINIFLIVSRIYVNRYLLTVSGVSSLLDFHLSICSLQEHLLKMTTEHRAEMALKRRKPAAVEEGW